MQIYRPRLTTLSESEILRYAGQKKDFGRPCGDVTGAGREGLLLTQPQCTWQLFDYDEENHRILLPTNHLDLCSVSLKNHLQGCQRIAALAVTIGDLLEKQVEKLFAAGSYTEALLLDAAGSVAVEAAADQADLTLAAQMAKIGLYTTRRFSPGYGDWDLSVQPVLLSLTGGSHINLSVTSSFMLTPRKSITAVIGLRPEWLKNPASEHLNDFIPCNLEGCLARKGDS